MGLKGMTVRRFLVGMLVALLLSLSSGASGQSPSPEPPPWLGGRVEMPEHGFALTLPEGWVAFDLTGDIEAQLRTGLAWFDDLSADAEQEFITLVAGTAASGSQLVAWHSSHPSSAGSCGFSVNDDPGIPHDVLAREMYHAITVNESIDKTEPPTRLELSVGPGWVFRLSKQQALSPLDHWPVVIYLAGDGERIVLASCSAEAPPTDDWLSIVDTVEFLPGAE